MARSFITAVFLASLAFPASGRAQEDGAPKSGRLDALGDPLPKGAITRIGTTRLGNQGQVVGLAFSPDGKQVASENGAGIVRLWDIATGKEVRAMKPPVPGWGPLAFAPDGKTLASSAGGKLVCVWEPATGRLLRGLDGHGDIRSIAFSPSGQLLATGSGDGSILIREPATGKTIHALKGHRDAPNGLAFSADNKTLASTGHDGTTRIWEVATGKELVKFAPNPFSNSSLLFAADGKTVIAAGGMNGDGILRFFDPAARKQVRQIYAHKGGALCMALSKNGNLLATGGFDRVIRFWNPETMAELGKLFEQTSRVNAIALSPDGDTVAWGTFNGTRVHLGKITGLPKSFQFAELFPGSGHDVGISAIRFSPDGKKLLTIGGDTAILWDELSGKELHRFNKGYCNAWSPDGKLVAFANPNDNLKRRIFVYDADTGKEVRRVSAPAQVFSAAFSPDRSTLIVGGTGGAVHLLELATGKVRASIQCDAGLIWRAAPAPDGYTVAAVCQKDIRILDTISGTELGQIPVTGQRAVYSPDGTILACAASNDGIVLWDLLKGKQLRRIPGRVFDLTFTPDGQTLAAACIDETIRLWDVATGKEVHSLVGHSGWIMSVGISPDGRTLVSGGMDTTLLLWPLDRFAKGKPPRAAPLSQKELQARLAKLPPGKPEQWWSDLGQADARQGYRAIWGLVADPKESIPVMQKWVADIGGTPIARWIADLDHAELDRREAATKKLERLGRLAEPALEAALERKPAPEARRRIERLLAHIEEGLGDGPDEGLRLLRTIEALEHIGTPEARAMLTVLAKNSPAPEPGEHARAALERLAKRP
jgi:WD40 repeat protein